MPIEGDKAPDVTLKAIDGSALPLSQFRGRTLILYFYPKDDTSGCTREAIDFSGALPDFEAAGATIVGVSKDPPKSHQKFIDKHGLSITLASDEEGAACEAFGVWVEKNMYGRKYMGVERSTFLIDGEGRIVRVWRKVKVPGHVDAVLEAVRAL